MILKCEPGSPDEDGRTVNLQNRGRVKDEFLLKEAETLINNYIRENKLRIIKDRHENRKKQVISKGLPDRLYHKLSNAGKHRTADIPCRQAVLKK